MFTFTSLDVLNTEHNLRVHKVNRFGWLRPATPDSGRSRKPGSVLSAIAALISRPNAARNASATTGQAQGAA
jgi:hypothetical protein